MRRTPITLLAAALLSLSLAVPVAAVDAPASATDLLPGVALVTEEVEPGVFRVVSDGVRDLSRQVRDVTVTPEGDVWVELGTPKNWDIVRLGEPGVSRELGRKDPWRLFTLDGAPVVSRSRSDSRLFDGEAWVDYEPSSCDSVEFSYLPGGIAADGECWAASGQLYRLDDDGTRDLLDMEEIGLGFDHIIDTATVTEDGTLWATVHSPRPYQFEGLVRYDGSTLERVPYDPSVDSPIDGLNWAGNAHVVVGPDGTVWVIDMYISPSRPPGGTRDFLLTSWDGDAWTTYGPVEAGLMAKLRFDAFRDAHFLDDGTVWFLNGLLVLDADGLKPQELPVGGDLVFGPDGSAWSVAEGGLYVITPEAVAVTE
jgi:hypothetical protein